MVVHIYGLPVQMDEVLKIAHKYGIKIIEDAAEMHGQKYKGKPCGSFGEISTFSFYPNKHITTGEGGMVVTDDPELAERCRLLRNLCFKKEFRYRHDEISDNYRFTNLQAAVGLAQLERLNEFVEKKRRIGAFYNDSLKGVEGISLPKQKTDYADNIYWVYGIVLGRCIKANNQKVQAMLAEKGIGTRTFFWCMHEQPVYLNSGMFEGESYPVAENLSRRGIYIPSGLALTNEQMRRVVEAVKAVIGELYQGENHGCV